MARKKRKSVAAIVPARYDSSRFPGKPLARINGKPMVQWVCEHALETTRDVFVATDDKRIARVVDDFGANVLFCEDDYTCGSERVMDAFVQLEENGYEYDYLLDLQVDEPMLHPADIRFLVDMMDRTDAMIGTLATEISNTKEANDPNVVKVVKNYKCEAMYFSRSRIPAIDKRVEYMFDGKVPPCEKHIGAYVFRKEVVRTLLAMPPTYHELLEGLEQLRWLDNGMTIAVGTTERDLISINTRADLRRIQKILSENVE